MRLGVRANAGPDESVKMAAPMIKNLVLRRIPFFVTGQVRLRLPHLGEVSVTNGTHIGVERPMRQRSMPVCRQS
jgi:hypothetical protein